MKKGFTLIETIIAVTILTVGTLGAARLIGYFVEYSSISNSRFTASYLTQEGIEIVKNIRDGNWLRGITWNTGLDAGVYEGDYKSANSFDSYQDRYLNIDADGFYSYSAGSPTQYKRKIEICTSTSGSDGIIYVSSTVSWLESGRPYFMKTEERIYNWYE